MALQVLPRDSEEYWTLSRQLISSVLGGSNVHDIRRNSFPSISHGNPTRNGIETSAGERRRTGSRRRSEVFETNVTINPRMEVANERRVNERLPDERTYPSIERSQRRSRNANVPRQAYNEDEHYEPNAINDVRNEQGVLNVRRTTMMQNNGAGTLRQRPYDNSDESSGDSIRIHGDRGRPHVYNDVRME